VNLYLRMMWWGTYSALTFWTVFELPDAFAGVLMIFVALVSGLVAFGPRAMSTGFGIHLGEQLFTRAAPPPEIQLRDMTSHHIATSAGSKLVVHTYPGLVYTHATGAQADSCMQCYTLRWERTQHRLRADNTKAALREWRTNNQRRSYGPVAR